MSVELGSDEVDNIIEYSPYSPNDEVNDDDSLCRVVYVCSICIRQYTLVDDLRGHMIEYHKYQPITPKAGDHTPTKKVVINDVPTVSSTKVAKSEIDDIDRMEVITQKSTVEIHPMPFKDFRMVLRSKMTMRCGFSNSCPYKFENASKLALHTKCHIEAATVQRFRCLSCSAEFESWRRCSAHLWKVHETDVDLLHCPQCAYKAHASVLVWRHMRVHKKWRARVIRSLRAVQQRRVSRITPKPVAESEAKKTVKKNKYYSEKTCEICERKFVNGKTLSKHVKTVHNKIKPFICNVCGKQTARKASLIIHMRQHTGEKPLQCKTCKFATRDPSVLHKHQQRHEKGGKFKCGLCDYTCIQTNAYKRHLRLNHPQEYQKIACDLCSYVTISAERLKVHKDDHRKGLVVNREDSMDAIGMGNFKNPRKLHDKNNEMSADCFLPLESIDSLPHEPAVDTGGVTIPAPSEDSQFPTYLNN